MALPPFKHAIGVLCCVVALATCIVACIVAWSGRRRFSPCWPVLISLTVVQFAFLIDMLLGLRWLLHDKLVREFEVHHLYGRRAGPQQVALILVAAAALTGVWLLLKSLRGRRGAQLTSCGMILWIVTWLAEVISLHSMDAFLRNTLAHVTIRDWLWIASSMMISCGVLLDVRSAPTTAASRSVPVVGEEAAKKLFRE